MTFQRCSVGQHDFVAVSVNLCGIVPLLGNGWHRVLVANCLTLCLGLLACLIFGLCLCNGFIMTHGILCRSAFILHTLYIVLNVAHLLPVVQYALCLVNLLLTLRLCLVVLLDAGANSWHLCRLRLDKCALRCLCLRCNKFVTLTA